MYSCACVEFLLPQVYPKAKVDTISYKESELIRSKLCLDLKGQDYDPQRHLTIYNILEENISCAYREEDTIKFIYFHREYTCPVPENLDLYNACSFILNGGFIEEVKGSHFNFFDTEQHIFNDQGCSCSTYKIHKQCIHSRTYNILRKNRKKFKEAYLLT